MRAPAFWARDGALARLLSPFSLIYRTASCARHRFTSARSVGIPVLCVGNLVAGGAGKTPVALALGAGLTAEGWSVAFLTRGHGGDLAGPIRVQPATHRAGDVGDEALLLAELAPTWVAHDRVAGALAARDGGAELIIMDDGFQNPSLAKTVSVVVIDGGFGFGNGRVHPAGPLREPVPRGLARADAIILVGEDRRNLQATLPATPPLARADITVTPDARLTPGTRVMGFAGIGRPAKFRQSLEGLDLDIAGFESFADHHVFTTAELDALLDTATRLNALAVTTAKDHVRLPDRYREKVARVNISLSWRDEAALFALVTEGLRHGSG